MHRDTNPRIVELKAAKLKHANDVDIIMKYNEYFWMIQFSACKIWQVSYKVFEALSKTAPKIVHYKARPPHTAILDSLGPPARPHHPCNPWICNWRNAAADVRVNFKVVGVDFEVFYRDQSSYPKLSRSCAGHLRTVQRHLRTVEALSVGLRVVFTSGLRAGSGLLGPLGVFCRGTGFRSPKFGWWVTDWCNQVTTSKICLNLQKSYVTVRKLCVTHLLFSWTFDVWPSICCISCFPLQSLTFIT